MGFGLERLIAHASTPPPTPIDESKVSPGVIGLLFFLASVAAVGLLGRSIIGRMKRLDAARQPGGWAERNSGHPSLPSPRRKPRLARLCRRKPCDRTLPLTTIDMIQVGVAQVGVMPVWVVPVSADVEPLTSTATAWRSWTTDWPMLAVAVGLSLAYLAGVHRAKRCGTRWPWYRIAAFLSGRLRWC